MRLLRRLPTVAFAIGASLGCLLTGYLYPLCRGNSPFLHQGTARAHAPVHVKPSARVMAAILLPRSLLNTTALAMLETWGADMGGFKILVGGGEPPSSGALERLPVVALEGVPDFESYESSLPQTYAAISHIHDSYLEQYDWFLLAEDRTYVAVQELERLVLQASDPRAVAYYWGRREKLVDSAEQYLCVGSSGVLISSAALKAVVPFLSDCANQLAGGRHTKRGDWGLGFCYSRLVGISCSTPFEHHFSYDNTNDLQQPGYLWANAPQLKVEGVVTFLATTTETYYILHHLVKQRQLEALKDEVTTLEGEVAGLRAKASSMFPQVTTPDSPTAPEREEPRPSTTYTPPSPPPQDQLQPSPSEGFSSMQQSEEASAMAVHPLTKFDVSAWTIIVGPYMYSDQRTDPLLRVPNDMDYEVQQFISKATDLINAEEKASYQLRGVNNVFLRYSPRYGRQCIMDLTLFEQTSGRVLRKRMNLASPPQVVPVLVAEQPNYRQVVNIIVPLNNVGERFTAFFDTFQRDVLRRRLAVRLILVVYGEEGDHDRITSIVTRDRSWPPSKLLVVQGRGEFARGRALDLGLSQLDGNELAFFCDTDMVMTREFLDRCRLNAVQGKRVYYPTFFSFYNMDYAYHGEQKPEQPVITRRNGHWVSYSYGMVCMYKSDYVTTGGFNLSITGWGGEDTDFFSKVLEAKLEVLKAPDPGLAHRWHPKHCSPSLAPSQYTDCLGTRDEVLADKKQLAAYVMYLEEYLGVNPGPFVNNNSSHHLPRVT